jgi:hypothetical protein
VPTSDSALARAVQGILRPSDVVRPGCQQSPGTSHDSSNRRYAFRSIEVAVEGPVPWARTVCVAMEISGYSAQKKQKRMCGARGGVRPGGSVRLPQAALFVTPILCFWVRRWKRSSVLARIPVASCFACEDGGIRSRALRVSRNLAYDPIFSSGLAVAFTCAHSYCLRPLPCSGSRWVWTGRQ